MPKSQDRKAVAPSEQADGAESPEMAKREEKRRARNADKPGQHEAGDRPIDSREERDRGPIGVDGRGAPGQSKPGRR